MKGKQVGYIRVSSTDQNTERQLDGIELDKVFTDPASGKDTKQHIFYELPRAQGPGLSNKRFRSWRRYARTI